MNHLPQLPQQEWIAIPIRSGWIVRVVFRPEDKEADLFTYDCICKIFVREGEPIRMMIPVGVVGVVLVVCVVGGREAEHLPVAMTLAKLPDDDVLIPPDKRAPLRSTQGAGPLGMQCECCGALLPRHEKNCPRAN